MVDTLNLFVIYPTSDRLLYSHTHSGNSPNIHHNKNLFFLKTRPNTGCSVRFGPTGHNEMFTLFIFFLVFLPPIAKASGVTADQD